MAILETREINYYYQDGDQKRVILNHANNKFEIGKFYTILGPSGSGKTTYLSLISALDAPKAGQVLCGHQDIRKIGYEEYRRNKIGIIFQSFNLIPYLTAVENVLLAMSVTDNELPSDHLATAYNLLDYIGIVRNKADRIVTQLSGGEQQRVAIARALATNVDIILADEPTGNLDGEMEEEIIEIFQELAHIHQKCVIMVTHSQEIAQVSDEVLYLEQGKLVAYE